MGNIDSLKLVSLQLKIDSLTTQVEKNEIGKTYFSDMLSHQWTLLTIQTAIFIAIITIILAFLSVITWQTVIKRHRARIERLEDDLATYESVKNKILEYDTKFEEVRRNALRALYEGISDPKWKIIHHIRYCEWFYDNNITDDLLTRLKKLEKELTSLKTSDEDFNSLKKFENSRGLHAVLKKIIQSENTEISSIAISVLNDLKT
jgi:hypothetical protein